MRRVIVAIGALSLFAAPAIAANANHPFQNCDKRVDNCGPTGDNMTDQLNAQQLGQPPTMPAPGGVPMGQPMQPMPMQQGQ